MWGWLRRAFTLALRARLYRCRPGESQTVIARLDRATQYAVTSRLITVGSGILVRPVKPGDDSVGDLARACPLNFYEFNFQTAPSTNTASRSRGAIRPRFAIKFLTLRSEGAGMPGASAPAHQRRGVRTARLRRPHWHRPSRAPLRPSHPVPDVRDVLA